MLIGPISGEQYHLGVTGVRMKAACSLKMTVVTKQQLFTRSVKRVCELSSPCVYMNTLEKPLFHLFIYLHINSAAICNAGRAGGLRGQMHAVQNYDT